MTPDEPASDTRASSPDAERDQRKGPRVYLSDQLLEGGGGGGSTMCCVTSQAGPVRRCGLLMMERDRAIFPSPFAAQQSQ